MTEAGPATTYEWAGLLIRSPFRLPGAAPAHVDHHDLDVALGPSRLAPSELPPGDVVVERRHRGRLWFAASRTGDGYVCRLPGMADFLLNASLDEVVCVPDPGQKTDMVPLLLSGVVTAFVLSILGRCVLHASGVVGHGEVLAFAGPTGTGKSTLAALFCASGALLVADDLLPVQALRCERRAVCTPTAGEVRLRPRAASLAELFPAGVARSVAADGRLTVAPVRAPGPALPLGAIVLPVLRRDQTEVAVRGLAPGEAMWHLARCLRIVGWTDKTVLSRQFDQLAALVTSVPVMEVDLPWRAPPHPGLVLQMLAALGLPRPGPSHRSSTCGIAESRDVS